jgi:multiple sugar transport system permease protein
METFAQQARTEEHALMRSQRHWRQRGWKRYSSWTFYLFVAPWMAGFLTLTLLPLVYALLVSFTNFDGISPHWHWVGLANYVELFQTSDTWYSLGQTLLFTLLVVPLSVAGGLALAMLLNERVKAVGVLRTIFYVPSIVPVVASTLMWKLIFDRDIGALNAILERLNIPVVTWLIDPTAFYALVIVMLWGLGGGMVISLAGLQGIPVELQEAASMDGANGWQVFRHITLPQLSPVLFFQVITGIIGALQVFIQPMLLSETNSVTGFSSTTVPHSNFLYLVNVLQQFLTFGRFGYGSAMLWIFFVVIMAITLLVFRSSGFWVYYEVDRDH